MVALDWVDLTNVASGIFISSVTGCFQGDTVPWFFEVDKHGNPW